ncbi:MAG: TonB-dependent receptor [Treponema sp.]|nr:TonB-dependent receptor [Treponema sp.]
MNRYSLLLSVFIFCFTLFADDLFDDDFFFFDTEGIVVVGTMQTTQQIAIIDREHIERRSAPDIAALLQETLHLNIDRYGPHGNQANISLRGNSSKRVAVLVDGIPVNSAMDGRFDIHQIDLNSVERIEVIYGGSDSRFNVSGAIGGVINIITVRRQEPGWRFSLSMSNTSVMPGEYNLNGQTQDPHWQDLFGTQNFTVSAAYGGEAFSFSANAFANRAANNFLFTDFTDNIRRKDNNEVLDAGLNTSMIWNLIDLTKLIASASFYYADKNIPTSGSSSLFGEQVDFVSRQSIMLETPRAFRDDLAAEAVLAWRFSRTDYTSPAGTFSRHDQYTLNAINRWNWYSSKRFTFRSSIDYRFTLINSTEIGSRDRHDGGISLTVEYKPLQQFMVIPSVRMVFATGGAGGITAVPKLGFMWNPADSLTLRNNYFRNFKFPEFEELYWNSGAGSAMRGIGNPNLFPEDGWGADLGVEWRINNHANIESVFFTQWLRNSIHWFSGAAGTLRPENVGEAAFFGLHNKFNFQIPVSLGFLNRIALSVSYQYLRSYLLSFGYNFASNQRIPYTPEHTIGGSLNFVWETGSLLISGHYESVRFHNRENTIRLPPHFLLNASVSQNIRESFVVFGSLRNILNTSYESFFDFPMPGITLTLGVRLNLEVK